MKLRVHRWVDFFPLPFCQRSPGPATLVGGGIQGQPELLKQPESAEAMGQRVGEAGPLQGKPRAVSHRSVLITAHVNSTRDCLAVITH